MYYSPDEGDRPLQIDPFKALVGPRPIGWVSTISAAGVANLAPYSFFNAVCDDPPMVMISSSGVKDTLRNLRETGEFVCNLASWDLRDAMNQSADAVPPDQDEFALTGLEKTPCVQVRPPRVSRAPAALECRVTQISPLKDLKGTTTNSHLIIGQVIGVHINDAFVAEGRVQTAQMQLLARHGYMDFSVVRETFRMPRPR